MEYDLESMKIIICVALAMALVGDRACLAKSIVNTTSSDTVCPVSISAMLLPPTTAEHYELTFKFKNQTGRVIIGESFVFEAMDTVGDYSDPPKVLFTGNLLKPGGAASGGSNLISVGLGGYRFYVRKIAFADGTTWQDDGTKKCQYTEDLRMR